MLETSGSTSFFDILAQMGGSATLLAFLAVGVLLGVRSVLKRKFARAEQVPSALSTIPDLPGDALLRAVETTRFTRKAPLSEAEMRLMRSLSVWERRQGKGYSVVTGLTLGTILSPANDDPSLLPALEQLAHVRTDFMILDKSGLPVLAVDLPGRCMGGPDAERDAALRQIAFDAAGLPLIAPEAGTSGADIVARVDRMLDTGLIKPKGAPVSPHRVAQVA
ncbi:hypothetical protein [Tropicimonas sp. S265A]|uniref:hypothetical protein n=1 Tax=Tropicimonas sp. S265A TaxID=3415134 RepID=UPI003C7EC11A